MLSLHRAHGNDWDNQPVKEWNIWQRLANATNGLIAPANFVSLGGFLLVCYGLNLIVDSAVIKGLLLVIVGRLADILDGIVADKTGTKSTLGEAVDVTLDKIIILLALIVLFTQQLVPGLVLLIILLHSLYISLLGLPSQLCHRPLHPSRLGKVTTGLAWTTLMLFILRSQLTLNHRYAAAAVLVLACVNFGLFAVGAFFSSLSYTSQLYKKASQ